VAAPAFNCTSLYRYTNIERLQKSVCGRNRYPIPGLARRFARPERAPCKSHNAAMWDASAGADAPAERRERF